MQSVRAVLFDVGNVIIEVDFEAVARAWATATAGDWQALYARFSHDSAYEQHETGEIGWPEYSAHLRRRLEVSICEADLLAGWNAVFRGPMDGIEALLSEIPRDLPVFGFSNTNAAHHAYFSRAYADLFERFTNVFCSHQLGRRKPDLAAYAAVVGEMGCAAQEVLFFDDSLTNVAAAARAGLVARQSRSTNETRVELLKAGVLDS